MKAHEMSECRGYRPIADYACIGDCHGAALVARDGSIDWACLRRFDADPIFNRLLDRRRGGYFQIEPAVEYSASREYLTGTNVLRTVFSTQRGAVVLTDFMPVGRVRQAATHDYVSLRAPFWIVRRFEGLHGEVPVRIVWRPSAGFARDEPVLRASGDRVQDRTGQMLIGDVELRVEDDAAVAELLVRRGDTRDLLVSPEPLDAMPDPAAVRRHLEVTCAFWTEWLEYGRYGGPHGDAVRRSALALKLLTYAPTGAIAAAATTSLPEVPGGESNWDYRFCWLRDGVFLLYALAALGYSGEAKRFAGFMMEACRASHPNLQIMYGLHHEVTLTEETVDHLEGYEGSRPVRAGNAAFSQRQLDVYGEVMDWALLYHALGARFSRQARGMLKSTAELVRRSWQEPDHGIWELRGEPAHYTLGKIMAWVALDRARQLFGRSAGLDEACRQIEQVVSERGIDSRGALREVLDRDGTDASLLLAATVGFPLPRGVFERTVGDIRRQLGSGDHLYRAQSLRAGGEGAFLACSFWLVSALLHLDRAAEARSLFDRLLGCANDVGLYAEEIVPETGAFLGNFPQALTHLALIEAATNLELHRSRGAEALRGSHADRARLGVEATAGLRGLWAAFKKSGRVGRVRSSRRSILA